ncbi:hypothetical protein [Candidatus Ichthyocystis sparus]|uniref:hypothetical protein n=1 Tax=Candidatus Ichthyocystis sparus TaxID=1561004 RepID=UPI000B8216C9|nr:hypothetical protein [Candidatus Ichthyocystis sparus]
MNIVPYGGNGGGNDFVHLVGGGDDAEEGAVGGAVGGNAPGGGAGPEGGGAVGVFGGLSQGGGHRSRSYTEGAVGSVRVVQPQQDNAGNEEPALDSRGEFLVTGGGRGPNDWRILDIDWSAVQQQSSRHRSRSDASGLGRGGRVSVQPVVPPPGGRNMVLVRRSALMLDAVRRFFRR